MRCPKCNNDLRMDPRNPGKVLCDTCKKRFEEDKVVDFWSRQGGVPAMPDVEGFDDTMPYIPPAGQQAPQIEPYGYDPYAPQQPRQAQPYAQQPGYGYAQQPQQFQAQPMPQQMPPQPYGAPQKEPGKGLAIASLVVAFLSLPVCWVPIINFASIGLALIDAILGIVAVVKASKGTGGGKALGIIGIILALISLVVAIVMNVLVFSNPSTDSGNDNVNLISVTDNSNAGNANAASNANVNTEVNANANVPSNANEANANANANAPATTPDSNANAPQQPQQQPQQPQQQSQQPQTPAVSGDLGNSWTSYTASIDGYTVVLGQTTLKDFLANTQFEFDTASAVINPNEIGMIYVSSPNVSAASGMPYVMVENPTDAPINSGDGVITKFRFDFYKLDNHPSVVLGGNIRLGESTFDDVNAAYGTSYYDSSNLNGTGRKTVSYQENGQYGSGLQVVFNDGVIVSGIELAKP